MRQWSLWLLYPEPRPFSFPPSTAIPVLDKHIPTELQLPPHSPMVTSSACLSLWTPALWMWVLAFPAETRLL